MRIFLIVPVILLAACGAEPQPPLVASDVEVSTPMPGMSVSAGYMLLTNNSDADILINSVSSPEFGTVEVHETTVVNGVARMRPISELLIRAGGSVRLEPGGLHLMMMRPQRDIETITLNLHHGDLLLMSLQTSPTFNGN